MVIDEWGDIQCIFFLLTRQLKVTNKLNISRYTNIDKFVHIRYIFLLARRAYIQLIISASTNVEITSPGRQASGFFNPCCIVKIFCCPERNGFTII
jgi:hypothetical protein